MLGLAERITAELEFLVGQPIDHSKRVANMQIFAFGPAKQFINRKGEAFEGCDIRLHVQCRWRMLNRSRIVFAADDLRRPADENIPINDFDWDKHDSVLDVVQRRWFAAHRTAPLKVAHVVGDPYGGCGIDLDGGFRLELIPCDSRRGEYSERWRLLGHRPDGSHFVVTGYGIEGDDESIEDGR